jgi:hypothetical protein
LQKARPGALVLGVAAGYVKVGRGCGHCGRKLHVHYSGKLGRYNCYGARVNHGTARCISISGLSIDAAISTEVLRILKPLGVDLRILKPLGVDAAVKAIEAQTSETTAAQRQLELSLQQARYEAAPARRQYDAVRLLDWLLYQWREPAIF